MRILGLDLGSHTVGMAISDELGLTAQPLRTLKRKSMGDDLREISSVIAKLDIHKIVIGLPRNMDGTLGKQAEIVFQWIKALKEEVHVPVVTWDERFSTVEASRVLLEADLSRRKRKGAIDRLAAVLILQGYLDRTGKQTDGPSLPT